MQNSYEEISFLSEPKKSNKFLSFLRNRRKTILIIFVCLLVAAGLFIGIGYYVTHRTERHPCADAAEQIIAAALSDSSLAYPRLAYLCNTFGNRLSGTATLENAIEWMAQEMARDNLSNPLLEPVMVPTWVRGNEHLYMHSPKEKYLGMLGLGGSANTSTAILGTVVVVNSWDDLKNKSSLVSGNIVLYNVPFTTYGATVGYRSAGAVEAAKYGAIAALVRSITPFSLYTPHTGGSQTASIPFAAVTVEDAAWMQDLYNNGGNITLELYMESHFEDDSVSHNVMAEVTGSTFPNEVVAIGGHTDSWDVGQGAMDDGGGVMVSWEAVRLIQSLGLKPKRTIRVVGWTNEENGARGGKMYAQEHQNETTVFALESDGGATTPLGVSVHNTFTDSGFDSISKIGNLLKSIGANGVQRGGGGVDIDPLVKFGVPIAGLWTDMSQYFWYHHTEADTIDKMDDMQMRKCAATMAVMAFCVADADEPLPRVSP